MEKLLAITVLYQPDFKKAKYNISKYIDDVDMLICWDNTPDLKLNCLQKQETLNFKRELENIYGTKIVFAGTGKNEYLPKAYNWAIDYAKGNGFTHLMTMDQDSVWHDFKYYRKKAEAVFEKDQVCLVSPQIVWDIKYAQNLETDNVNETSSAINSGLILPLSLIKNGGYCERFYVDCVDTELTMRVRNMGYKIYEIQGRGYLAQTFGNFHWWKPKFFKQKIRCYNYSPFRLYGIYRNRILLSRIYPDDYNNKAYIKRELFKFYIFNIIFHENQKCSKLWAILKGTFNGLTTTKKLDPIYSKA